MRGSWASRRRLVPAPSLVRWTSSSSDLKRKSLDANHVCMHGEARLHVGVRITQNQREAGEEHKHGMAAEAPATLSRQRKLKCRKQKTKTVLMFTHLSASQGLELSHVGRTTYWAASPAGKLEKPSRPRASQGSAAIHPRMERTGGSWSHLPDPRN